MPVLEPLAKDITEPSDIVTAIRKRRGGELLKLDRMLLHSPAFAEGWNSHLAKVRQSLQLDAQLRELAICAVAIVNRAPYELEQHLPFYRAAGGTNEKCEALHGLGSNNKIPGGFNALESDVIEIALQMTQSIEVESALKTRLLKVLGPQQLVELVGVVSTYNMVSRFLVALDLHAE